MSAWRLLTRALHQHGPMTRERLEVHLQCGLHTGLTDAGRLGLVNMPGRVMPSNQRWVYSLTDLGHMWAEGKAVFCSAQQIRPRARPGKCIRPNWLASLPDTNEIRLQSQRNGTTS